MRTRDYNTNDQMDNSRVTPINRLDVQSQDLVHFIVPSKEMVGAALALSANV